MYRSGYRVKSKRNHKKRHGVNRERSRVARARHRRGVYKQMIYLRGLRTHRAAMRLYWSGAAEDLDTARAMVS